MLESGGFEHLCHRLFAVGPLERRKSHRFLGRNEFLGDDCEMMSGPGDGGRRVVDLVQQPRRQLAQRGELFVPIEGGLALAQTSRHRAHHRSEQARIGEDLTEHLDGYLYQ